MPEVSGIGVLTAFAAGIVSFLSPCVLPLVPGYISYVAGRSLDDAAGEARTATLHALGLSLCFVLGFTVVFSLLGASATMIGWLFLAYRASGEHRDDQARYSYCGCEDVIGDAADRRSRWS